MQCMKRSLKLSYICVYVCVCMKNLLLQQKIRESPIKAKLSLWRSSKFAFNVVSAWQPIDTMPTESPPTLPATRKWQHLHIHITYIYVLKMHSSVLCNVSGCVCVASTARCPLTHTHTHRHVAILLCYGQIIWVRRVYLTIGNTHFTYVTDEANEADEADQAATGMLRYNSTMLAKPAQCTCCRLHRYDGHNYRKVESRRKQAVRCCCYNAAAIVVLSCLNVSEKCQAQDSRKEFKANRHTE